MYQVLMAGEVETVPANTLDPSPHWAPIVLNDKKVKRGKFAWRLYLATNSAQNKNDTAQHIFQHAYLRQQLQRGQAGVQTRIGCKGSPKKLYLHNVRN